MTAVLPRLIQFYGGPESGLHAQIQDGRVHSFSANGVIIMGFGLPGGENHVGLRPDQADRLLQGTEHGSLSDGAAQAFVGVPSTAVRSYLALNSGAISGQWSMARGTSDASLKPLFASGAAALLGSYGIPNSFIGSAQDFVPTLPELIAGELQLIQESDVAARVRQLDRETAWSAAVQSLEGPQVADQIERIMLQFAALLPYFPDRQDYLLELIFAKIMTPGESPDLLDRTNDEHITAFVHLLNAMNLEIFPKVQIAIFVGVLLSWKGKFEGQPDYSLIEQVYQKYSSAISERFSS